MFAVATGITNISFSHGVQAWTSLQSILFDVCGSLPRFEEISFAGLSNDIAANNDEMAKLKEKLRLLKTL